MGHKKTAKIAIHNETRPFGRHDLHLWHIRIRVVAIGNGIRQPFQAARGSLGQADLRSKGGTTSTN